MTTVANAVRVRPEPSVRSAPRQVRVALLGLGHVGCAIAAHAAARIEPEVDFTLTAALVRNPQRPRAVDVSAIPVTTDADAVLSSNPDVLVEVLGGLEPARTLVLAAIARGIPVVTANKSLLAAHGDELFEAAARAGVPLLYEASVIAGVPFLGTFRRRSIARRLAGLSGIVNGTSNYILSRMNREGIGFDEALAAATRAGYAEPDPSNDLDGRDATEKLCVLLRHFAGRSVAPAAVERIGIGAVRLADLRQAAAFGGTIRPAVAAAWGNDRLTAFVGPVFVDAAHPLARIDGVQNAIALETQWSGDLLFSGPGAGPAVTAATILDDVLEAQRFAESAAAPAVERSGCDAPETGWFVRLASCSAAAGENEAATLFASLGVRVRRISSFDAERQQWLLTTPCSRAHITAALELHAARTGCQPWCIRSME